IYNKVEQKRDLKETFSGFTNSLKEPIVLLTGFSILAVYTAFIVVNVYFTPFLIDVYQLPATFVGYFALVNGAATRMLSAPFSGLIADKNFKTSAHFMKFCFVLLAMLIGGVLLVPKTQGFMYIVMLFLMASTIICYFIRGIYFAPLGEAKLPIESAAAANSIASFIGYSPTFWGYPLFGYIIDKTGSYDLIFILLIVLALFGIIINQVNGKLILNRREKTA
ncbi:MAG TPA: MFS transporter, partial [Erysipelothrix sp.]